MQELGELMADPVPNFSVEPNENNMAIWTVTINGPVRYTITNPRLCSSLQPQPSPYNGGKFKLRVEFGLDYPFKAPQVGPGSFSC